MARNEEVRSTVGSGKTLSWWQILALVLLMVLVFFFGRLSALRSITVVDNNNSTASAAPANQSKAADVIVTDNQPVTAEVSAGNVGGNAGPSIRKPTYLSEYSCSDLDTCLVKTVPQGHFSIGFKKVQGGCDWWLYQEGEAIPFAKLDEFHTYNGDLPLTNLDGFVKGESEYVYSCK